MIGSATIPLAGAVLTQVYPRLFNLAGGTRYYALQPRSNQVHVYLPVPAPKTRLVFVCIDTTHACSVRSKIAAPLCGSATAIVSFTEIGDYLELVPDSDTAPTQWLQLVHSVIIR